jgi:hypothetical protein
MWFWFSSLRPNYLFHLLAPMFVLLAGWLVVPMLVLFVGGVAGLFKLQVPYLTVPAHVGLASSRARRRKYYTIAAIFTGVAMISIMFHVPVFARFAFSRGAMNAFLAEVQQNPDATRSATMRVGSYTLETTPQWRRDGAVMFFLAGNHETGFTYSTQPIKYPGGNPGASGSLGGGWHWFSDD